MLLWVLTWENMNRTIKVGFPNVYEFFPPSWKKKKRKNSALVILLLTVTRALVYYLHSCSCFGVLFVCFLYRSVGLECCREKALVNDALIDISLYV